MNSYSGSGFVIIQFRANPHNAYIYSVHKESFRVSHNPDGTDETGQGAQSDFGADLLSSFTRSPHGLRPK